MYRELAPLVRYLINPMAGIVALAEVTLMPMLLMPRTFVSILDGAALGASYAASSARRPLWTQ